MSTQKFGRSLNERLIADLKHCNRSRDLDF